MRGIVLVLLAAVLVVPSPVAAAETGAVELTGSTVVTTARSGQVRVSVPHDATVDAASFATVTGEGRFFGVVLTRAGDETSFQASHMLYPAEEGGFRHSASSVRLDAVDADEPDPLNPLDVPTGRACSQDCRLPAGEYDLLIVADGAPVRATITVEGLNGARELDATGLDPLRTEQMVSDREVRAWEGTINGGYGLSSTTGFFDQDPGLVFSTLRSHVTSELAGTLEITFCVTVESECHDQSSRHAYVANAVQGPEGLSSYGSQALPAGRHGLQVSYQRDGFGSGEFHYERAAVFIYP